MRTSFFHIALFLFCLQGMAQHIENLDKTGFYSTLALNDARYEQNLQHFGAEDEADFWKDQRQFETALQAANPVGHQAYLNGKHIAYGRHQRHCNTSCGHSDLYLRQASYYAINGTAVSNMLSVSTSATAASSTALKTRIPK